MRTAFVFTVGILMRRIVYFLAWAGMLCAVLPAAFAIALLPEPREDVTLLEKPTICYITQPPGEINVDEIRLVDLDGQNDRLWIGDGKVSFTGGVEWSPDGKRAAITVFDPDDWTYTPYILDLKTGKARSLANWLPVEEIMWFYFDWSPNGKWLAMSRIPSTPPNQIDQAQAEIYKLHADAGRLVRLTKEPFINNWRPDWSSDGERIAYDAENGNTRNIYAIDAADGNNRVNLTRLPYYSSRPFWSPDGSWIAFLSYPGAGGDREWAKAEIYLMRPDGSNVERLTFNEVGDFPKGWSPDSKWLLFRSFIVENGEYIDGIYRMHVETREVRRITLVRSGGRGLQPTWVLAGKSGFVSVEPMGKKMCHWGCMKCGCGNETAPVE